MTEPVSNETTRLKLLTDLLREHQCRSDGAMTVSQCIDSGRCGCSVGLLLVSNETNGWRDISTAPRDGTAIWLLIDGYAAIGHFDPCDEPWSTPQWFTKSSFRRADEGRKQRGLPDEIFGCYAFGFKPIAWQLLPDPLPTREPEER